MKWAFEPAASFAQRAAQWRALNAATLASPLLEPEFVMPLLEHFGKGEVLARCEQGGEIVAMALLSRRRTGTWETFQPSQAPVGMWLQDPGLDTGVLMAGLMRALPGFALVLSLLQRDPALEARPAGLSPPWLDAYWKSCSPRRVSLTALSTILALESHRRFR